MSNDSYLEGLMIHIDYIKEILTNEYNGNSSALARDIGISKQTMLNLLKNSKVSGSTMLSLINYSISRGDPLNKFIEIEDQISSVKTMIDDVVVIADPDSKLGATIKRIDTHEYIVTSKGDLIKIIEKGLHYGG